MNDQEKVNKNKKVINAYPPFPKIESKDSNIGFAPDLQNNVHSLKLKNKSIYDFVLASIFQRVPSLKLLELYNIQLITTGKCVIGPNSYQLNTLVFNNSSYEILKFITPVNIASVQLTALNLEQNPNYTYFLMQCKNLVKLNIYAIKNGIMDFFTNTSVFRFPFQLRNLSLSSPISYSVVPNNNEEAMNFLKRYATSLNDLEIRAQLSLDVLEFLLKKLRLLKSLVLRLNFLPIDASFYAIRNPKKNLKKLILEGPYINLDQIEAILKLFPALQCLSLDNFIVDFSLTLMAQILEQVSRHCPDITNLTISRIPLLSENVEFNALTSLRIKYINSVSEIISFIKNARNLKELHVEFVHRNQLSKTDVDQLLMVKLSRLYITAEPHEAHKICKMIENNHEKTLEELEVRVHAFNYQKYYNFRYSNEANCQLVAAKMKDDLKDFLLNELLASVEGNYDSDDDIIDYLTLDD